MATIRKRNGRWQAQIRKSGTRAISRTFTLRQDALFWSREQARVLELETDVLEKKTLLKKTLADLLHDYEMEADFGDVEMQLTAYRGVVLEEHISKD